MHLTLNKRRLLIVGLASLGLAIGCSLPGRLLQQASEGVLPPPPEGLATPEREAQETPPQGVPGGSAGSDLGGLVGWGDVDLVDVTANGEISGPGIGVVVRNPGPEEITVVIPCGFTFLPGDSSDQRLMVVQEASATIPAGGEETLTAFVICIDPTSSAPDDGETYSMGAMESGDLLRLAPCV